MTRRHGPVAVAATVLGAALIGATGGLLLSRSYQSANRHELFDRRPWRRLAALGWLERSGDRSAVPVLRDYLRWEPQPLLAARAQRLIRDLEVAA